MTRTMIYEILHPVYRIDLITAFGAQKKAYCRRREKGQAKRTPETGENEEAEIENHKASEDVANNADMMFVFILSIISTLLSANTS